MTDSHPHVNINSKTKDGHVQGQNNWFTWCIDRLCEVLYNRAG